MVQNKDKSSTLLRTSLAEVWKTGHMELYEGVVLTPLHHTPDLISSVMPQVALRTYSENLFDMVV